MRKLFILPMLIALLTVPWLGGSAMADGMPEQVDTPLAAQAAQATPPAQIPKPTLGRYGCYRDTNGKLQPAQGDTPFLCENGEIAWVNPKLHRQPVAQTNGLHPVAPRQPTLREQRVTHLNQRKEYLLEQCSFDGKFWVNPKCKPEIEAFNAQVRQFHVDFPAQPAAQPVQQAPAAALSDALPATPPVEHPKATGPQTPATHLGRQAQVVVNDGNGTTTISGKPEDLTPDGPNVFRGETGRQADTSAGSVDDLNGGGKRVTIHDHGQGERPVAQISSAGSDGNGAGYAKTSVDARTAPVNQTGPLSISVDPPEQLDLGKDGETRNVVIDTTDATATAGVTGDGDALIASIEADLVEAEAGVKANAEEAERAAGKGPLVAMAETGNPVNGSPLAAEAMAKYTADGCVMKRDGVNYFVSASVCDTCDNHTMHSETLKGNVCEGEPILY